MGCCTSAKPGAKAPQAQGPKPGPQAPPQAAARPTPAVPMLFMPVVGEAAMLYYNCSDNSAFKVPVSVPFKFRYRSGVVFSQKTGRMHFVGGFNREIRADSLMSAQADDFTEKCMTYETLTLTGWESTYPRAVGYMTLLLSQRGEEEDVYSIGGCQIAMGIDDDLEQGTFAVMRHNMQKWDALPVMPSQKYCCPLAVLLNGAIFCAGGFLVVDGRKEPKDSIMVYRIQTNAWTPVTFKFPQILHCLAAQLEGPEYLIFNIKQASGKSLTLTETKLLNSPIPDCPDKDFWYPVYQSANQFFLFSDDCYLSVFDKQKKVWTESNLGNSMQPQVDYAKLQGVVPRPLKYYAFHVDVSEKKLKEFNTLSNWVTTTSYERKFMENAGICAVPETGEILMCGGRDPASDQLARVCYAVMPGTPRARNVGNLPQPQEGLRMVLIDKQIYALAGFNDSTCFFQALNSIASPNWVQLPAAPEALMYPVCFELKQVIYMIGGQKLKEPSKLCGDVVTFTVQTMTWTKLPIVFPLEFYHASAISHTKLGSVLIFGGDNMKDEPINVCYLFDGKQFTAEPEITDSVELIFDDPPCYREDDVYVCNHHGDYFRLNLTTRTWTSMEGEEDSEGISPNRA